MFNRINPKECFDKRHSITFEDKIKYCKEKALYQMNYDIDLDNPKSLNEKIIYQALYYHNPEVKIASDKISAKDWIASRIGKEYVPKLIATFDKVSDFKRAFDSLPQKFVIKSNCGWAAKTVRVVFKSSLDFSALCDELEEWLKPWNNYYYNNSCVGNENIEPRLLVEELLGEGKPINDYKLFVMNGKAQLFYVVEDRLGESETKTFLDLDWNILPCHRYDVPASNYVEKPPCVQEMISLGEQLAKDFPLVRVDFYFVDGRLYVGELTFTPGMFLSIEPKEWDIKLGQLLDVLKIKKPED